VRGQDKIHAPSPHSPVRDCVVILNPHECHSEPQAKNLTIPPSNKKQILRLPPQDDIGTQSLKGEEVREEAWRSCRAQRNFPSRVSRGLSVSVVLVFAVLAGCQQKMADQPRYEPLAKSDFFGDERSARPLVEGTVARGQLRSDEELYTGKTNGTLTETLPFPVTKNVLLRGQERYDIFCSPCHDRVGTGQGMVVRRGLRSPPSFHTDRLRAAPAGHFFDVITHGFGIMPDYAVQVSPKDRWVIVAYIRALQLSQNAKLADVPESERRSLETKP
jgi:hypothetical protein